MPRRASSGILAPLPIDSVRHAANRCRSVVALAVLLSGLDVSPSQALTLTTSGSGLTSCGDALCLDLSWQWSGATSDPAGETTLILPVADPDEWSLSGGLISTVGDTVSFSGTFDRSDLANDPPGSSHGHSTARFWTRGADGTLLTENSTGLSAFCEPGVTSQVTCGDGNGTNFSFYAPIPGDAFRLGSLTLSYDFAPEWRTEPLDQEFRIDFRGSTHLVYTSVPEPGAALILAVGLLTVAVTRRRA
jgi:hypothetical protein